MRPTIRAFVFIAKNRSKILSFSIVVFIFGIVASGSILVQQAMQNADSNLRQRLPPVVSIGIDYEAAQRLADDVGEWPEITTLSFDAYSKLGALPYVKNYDISVGGNLLSKDLERVTSANEDMAITDFGTGDWMPLSLKGVHSSNLVDVEEGIIEITFGRIFSEQEVTSLSYTALISGDFARHNNLHIGSTFDLYNIVWDKRDTTFTNPNFYTEENVYAQRFYNFEVIGIFEPLVQFDTGDEWNDIFLLDEHLNRIYVPNPVTMAAHMYQIEHQAQLEPDNIWLQGDPKDSLWISNVYILRNQSDIENFKQAAESILPTFWMVIDTSNSFAGGILSSMESMRRIVSIALWIAIGASVTILSLLITLLVHKRKREIGILLALGERKIGVMAQMMIEVYAVTFLAITLSLFVGNLLASGISEVMLRNDMVAAQNGGESGMIAFTHLDMMGFGSTDVSTEEILASYSISLGFEVLGLFFVLAIGVVAAATTIPMLYIIRLNPRKILM